MRRLLMRFGILISALALSSAAAQEPFPGLDAYIAKALQASKIPGIAVAIVRNDSVLYTKGFGVLAAGSTTPVDECAAGRLCRSTIVVVTTSMSCPRATRRRTSSPAATTGPPKARDGDQAGAANRMRTVP